MSYAYAVELFFDPVTEALIKHTWADIAEKAKLPNKMNDIKGIRPHLTLGAFGTVDSERFMAGLFHLSAQQAPFEISLDSLGIFNGTHGVLFFAPAANRTLLDFHKNFYELLSKFATSWDPNYLPGKLVFHCSLNIGLDKGELMRAATAAMDTPLPMLVRAESVGLLKLPIDDFNRTFALHGRDEAPHSEEGYGNAKSERQLSGLS